MRPPEMSASIWITYIFLRYLESLGRYDAMTVDPLATPCLLYCGSCRYYMNEECRGCGSEDRSDCKIFKYCRTDKELRFCTECNEFLCEVLKKSIGVNPGGLEDQAKFPLKKQ